MSHYSCRQCGQRYDDCCCVGNPLIYKVSHDKETRTLDVDILVKMIYPTAEKIEEEINRFMLEQGYLRK